jgi:hypothetical protein
MINEIIKDKNISPIRPSVTPNSAFNKRNIKNKIPNFSISEPLTTKYIRPFTGIMNAKKIVKNHINKMLATLNESLIDDKKKDSKFDGK